MLTDVVQRLNDPLSRTSRDIQQRAEVAQQASDRARATSGDGRGRNIHCCDWRESVQGDSAEVECDDLAPAAAARHPECRGEVLRHDVGSENATVSLEHTGGLQSDESARNVLDQMK